MKQLVPFNLDKAICNMGARDTIRTHENKSVTDLQIYHTPNNHGSMVIVSGFVGGEFYGWDQCGFPLTGSTESMPWPRLMILEEVEEETEVKCTCWVIVYRNFTDGEPISCTFHTEKEVKDLREQWGERIISVQEIKYSKYMKYVE